MQLAVMDPADRNGELVAHSVSECTWLCKREVMRIRGHAAAHEARLSQHESPVILIAQANRFSQSADGIAARLLLAGSRRGFLAGTRVRRAGHWGLGGMHERAELIGGHLEIWSRQESGTEVELSIPASVAYATSPAGRFRLFAKKTGTNS